MPDQSPVEPSHLAQPARLARELQTELDRANAQLQLLEPEYAQLLADPDVIQEDRDTARVVLEHARQNVQHAQRAIERAEAGAYGLCSVCNEPIGDERLAALPDVEMCVRCEVQR